MDDTGLVKVVGIDGIGLACPGTIVLLGGKALVIAVSCVRSTGDNHMTVDELGRSRLSQYTYVSERTRRWSR